MFKKVVRAGISVVLGMGVIMTTVSPASAGNFHAPVAKAAANCPLTSPGRMDRDANYVRYTYIHDTGLRLGGWIWHRYNCYWAKVAFQAGPRSNPHLCSLGYLVHWRGRGNIIDNKFTYRKPATRACPYNGQVASLPYLATTA